MRHEINAKHLRPRAQFEGRDMRSENLDRGGPFFGTFFGQAKKGRKELFSLLFA